MTNNLENKLVEVVEIEAPHGVLDIGNTVEMFQNTIREQIIQSVYPQVIWVFEESANFSREEAESLSSDIKKGVAPSIAMTKRLYNLAAHTLLTIKVFFKVLLPSSWRNVNISVFILYFMTGLPV
jgi:hypothetical protein